VPSNLPKIAMLWSQFAAYHMDRCDAVALRLDGRAEVLAVEVASASQTYAWEPSGELSAARKLTLFPGQSYESIGSLRRLVAQFRALWRCRMVCIGIPYTSPEIVVLSWLLWLCGVRVVLMSESKFDDFPRNLFVEFIKRLALSPYCAAIVGGRRHIAYMHFLEFRRRLVLPGYDCVSIDRVRRQAGNTRVAHSTRYFVFVGRFISKKNLHALIEAYAIYAKKAQEEARKLVLTGSGEVESELKQRASQLGLTDKIEFRGFLSAEQVSGVLAGALALVLVSTVEQWGLVVNEALAVGLPVIVSEPVGSRDALVRNLVNGFVNEANSLEGFAHAMRLMAGDEAHWHELSSGSQARAWMGDTARIADAVEFLFTPESTSAGERIAAFLAEMGPEPEKGEA
jgi:L-malate glycosyltransferase